MLNIFSDEIQSFVSKKLYRYRFLARYVIIGFLSIIFELIIFRALRGSVPDLLAKFIGVSVSIIFAFVFNVRFNFKVPKSKRNRAFVYFVGIAILSLILNLILMDYFLITIMPYELSRITSSGMLFIIAYVLNRKLSFKGYKKVGVAIYSHGEENIKVIWDKIGALADFIHVDIVDETFNPAALRPAVYRLETVKAYWPKKEIHCHIMSKTPRKWLDQTIKYSDTVVIHCEVEEDLQSLINVIKSAGKKVGLCLNFSTRIEVVEPYLDAVDEIMLLAIKKPGCSGQHFNVEVLEKIEKLNAMHKTQNISICVDGGVNEKIIGLLNIEKVISGSFVLDSKNPKLKIMQLQTSSQYEICQ